MRGQSLFEVVLALAIIALIAVALVSLTTLSIRNTSFSKTETQANRFAQEAIEWLRGQRDTYANFFDLSGNYCLNSLSFASASWPCSGNISGTVFKRELFVSNVTGELEKTVLKTEVAVSWSDSQGIHETRSITYFSDWR